GAVDRGAAAEQIIGDARHVALVVGDARDLAHRVVDVGGVKNRGAAVVELVHRGDLRADVVELLPAHALSVNYRGAEPGLPGAIGPEVIGRCGYSVVGDRDLRRAVEDVVRGDRWLHGVERGVEDALLAQRLGDRIELLDGTLERVEDDAAGHGHYVSG